MAGAESAGANDSTAGHHLGGYLSPSRMQLMRLEVIPVLTNL